MPSYMFDYMLVIIIPAVPIIILVFTVMWGRVKRAEAESIGKRSFEKLANELKEDNAYLKIKLTIIEERLASVDKMLKEVE